MTIDKSLKVRRGSTGNRSVLSRAERLDRLKETDKWQEGMPVLGLPKVRVRKISMKKKKKKAAEGDDAAATAPAKGGAKAAAPAKGAAAAKAPAKK
jgi:small basic protein (TIGR04137 family)